MLPNRNIHTYAGIKCSVSSFPFTIVLVSKNCNFNKFTIKRFKCKNRLYSKVIQFTKIAIKRNESIYLFLFETRPSYSLLATIQQQFSSVE